MIKVPNSPRTKAVAIHLKVPCLFADLNFSGARTSYMCDSAIPRSIFNFLKLIRETQREGWGGYHSNTPPSMELTPSYHKGSLVVLRCGFRASWTVNHLVYWMGCFLIWVIFHFNTGNNGLWCQEKNFFNLHFIS